MTECERIIQQGILDKKFFEEEKRCDFLVTTHRKKIWAVEIDLLLEFDRVCKKHNLKYFFEAGSLLGAVRHGGFIPWDDDIDVTMPRTDYEKFLTLKDEFKEPYFLQTPYTDNGYFYSFAKLKNSNTTGWNRTFAYQKFNFGICIDVFPLDDIKIENAKENFERVTNLILDNSTYMKISNPKPAQKDLERIAKYKEKYPDGGEPLKRYEKIQSIARQFENMQTKFVALICCPVYGLDRNIWETADFAESVDIDFEGFKFPVPRDYERVLEIKYGDWKKFPPIEERGKWHPDTIFEPDIPYKKYIEQHGGIFPDEELDAQKNKM